MSTFDADASDIHPIKKLKEFMREFNSESKKLWYLAAPAIFNLVSQYSIIAITQMFAGHVGNIQLAAVSVDNNLIGKSASTELLEVTISHMVIEVHSVKIII
nr:protein DETOXIFICATION 29 isoform X2 [Ipomoea trifida]